MTNKIFEKVNQISVLANSIRFKILLALFNSDVKIDNTKIGTHSHSFGDLQKIVNIKKPDLGYHLNIMNSSNLIEKDKKIKGIYHISKEGKEILKKFGVSRKLVREEVRKIL